MAKTQKKDKKCKYCSSKIPGDAKKCPICREYLEGGFMRTFSASLAMVLSLLVSLSIIGVNYFQIQNFKNELIEKEQEIDVLEQTKNAVVQETQNILNERTTPPLELLSSSSERISEDSLRQSIQKLSGEKNKVLREAFKLKDENIQFKWGGKKPSEGFDSSGFVAYILHKYQIIKENYQSYWSGKLRAAFDPIDTPNVGDLIFYDAGYVMFYLGDEKCIGMDSNGIHVRNKDFGPKIKGYRQIKYD